MRLAVSKYCYASRELGVTELKDDQTKRRVSTTIEELNRCSLDSMLVIYLNYWMFFGGTQITDKFVPPPLVYQKVLKVNIKQEVDNKILLLA